LTELQKEAYKFYGINPSRTLQIAQSLYLAGLISYPRTSSQQVPESIGYKEILKKLSKKFKLKDFLKEKSQFKERNQTQLILRFIRLEILLFLSDQDEKIYN
jgi:DNA topoisomerase-1